MELDRAVVIGLGCRRGVSAEALDAAIAVARAGSGESPAPRALATAWFKQDEPAFAALAARLGVPLVFVEREALEAAAPRLLTRNDRVAALVGIGSVAEAAALAAAGPGSRLLAPRSVHGDVTCAFALAGE